MIHTDYTPPFFWLGREAEAALRDAIWPDIFPELPVGNFRVDVPGAPDDE